MHDEIVSVSDVSLTYRIVHGASSSIKESALNFIQRRISTTDFTALNDVSFTLNRGETLAVIGRNGAGKSTLLKVLARVLPPTKGRVIVRGSVAPMIELAAGFNPELTGTENAVLYSAILGRDVKRVRARLETIADWAGVADHMDTPIRTFSSGMVARLAFAVATDEIPDLLLVDEVLSVGDAEFREKSGLRMRELMAQDTGVVLVTHDLETVRKMATRALWLERGKARAFGDVEEVVDAYVADQKN
ncbi:teichoic acids export ATP-binding protein TagH [mine drainage metagenome]|uniref:Teichoic acids export ATP-binding protein TagH n=1 Tax=mine drainage metagenome TaxID=410659 RepID=A0A1J5Q3T2_9ZZZZ